MVLDLNKNFGGSTDLAKKKRHRSADLHTPIHGFNVKSVSQLTILYPWTEGIQGASDQQTA